MEQMAYTCTTGEISRHKNNIILLFVTTGVEVGGAVMLVKQTRHREASPTRPHSPVDSEAVVLRM